MSERRTGEISDKNFVVLLVLTILVGEFGIDRFYVGKVGTGILKLITLGGIGIWWLVDIILVVTGSFTDGHGRPIPAKV